MTSIKRIFASVTAGLVALSAVPAQALELGRMGSFDQAVEELKKDGWEPVAAGIIPMFSKSTQPKSGMMEDSIIPPNPMVVIFNQKGTQNWRIGSRLGDGFILEKEGEGLTLLPLDTPGAIAVSYNVPVQQRPGIPQVQCGPTENMKDIFEKRMGAVKVVEGTTKDGESKISFYVGYQAGNQAWALAETRDDVTCVPLSGMGFQLNMLRPEFTPEWQRNLAKPF